MRIMGSLLFCLFCSIPLVAFGDEISAAREGAPNHVSDMASIMIWENGQYVEKISGTNEFVCLVWADKEGTFEPSCFNNAAIKAVLPVYQFQRNLLEKGMTIEKIIAQIELKVKKGIFPVPEPGAVVYMMSKRNKY